MQAFVQVNRQIQGLVASPTLKFHSCANTDGRIMLLQNSLLNVSALYHLTMAASAVVFAHNFLPSLHISSFHRC